MEEFLKSGNITQSALKAGYKESYAESLACRILDRPEVIEYKEKVQEKINSEKIADVREIQEFWASVLRDKGIEIKDRLKASEYIAKTNAMFSEKIQISGAINNPFKDLSSNDLKKLIDNDR